MKSPQTQFFLALHILDPVSHRPGYYPTVHTRTLTESKVPSIDTVGVPEVVPSFECRTTYSITNSCETGMLTSTEYMWHTGRTSTVVF